MDEFFSRASWLIVCIDQLFRFVQSYSEHWKPPTRQIALSWCVREQDSVGKEDRVRYEVRFHSASHPEQEKGFRLEIYDQNIAQTMNVLLIHCRHKKKPLTY